MRKNYELGWLGGFSNSFSYPRGNDIGVSFRHDICGPNRECAFILFYFIVEILDLFLLLMIKKFQ